VITAAAIVLAAVGAAAGWLPQASAGRARAGTTGPLVALSPATGKIVARAPAFAPAGATVDAIVADGRGGWWIGGTFRGADGVRCPNLVHLLPGLRVDRTSCLGVNGPVYRLVSSGSRLFVSGGFTRIGGVRRKYLAAVDARTGSVLPWDAHPDDIVGDLAVSGSTLYVEGVFAHIGGKHRFALAAVDVRTGGATAWDPEPDTNEHGDSVSSIAADRSAVFVAGQFSHVGGARRLGFAALDPATGKALPFKRDAGNPLVANGKLYLDVRPGRYGPRKSEAFLLPSLVRDRRWAPRFDGPFAVDGPVAYSSFRTSAEGAPDQEQVVALDSTTGSLRWRSPVFSHPFNPYGGSAIVTVSFAVASSPAYVLVGGNFQRVRT
jgi:outer membrane protein assembly factor BamB